MNIRSFHSLKQNKKEIGMKASRVNQILLLFFIFCFVESRPHRKDWSSLNFELLEEEWKKGDDPQELATLDDELYEAYEKHQKRMKHELRSNKKIDPLHMAEIENAGKPAMIFATLSKDTKQKWDWDELSDICIGWAVSSSNFFLYSDLKGHVILINIHFSPLLLYSLFVLDLIIPLSSTGPSPIFGHSNQMLSYCSRSHHGNITKNLARSRRLRIFIS